MSKKSDAAPQPMDPSFREKKVGVTGVNNQRVCYAIKTMVKEVHDLFPETPVEYSDYDGRNTALTVTFDLTVLDNDDADTFTALLTLFDFDADARIDYVLAADSAVLVSFKSNPRTQDSREPFGLAQAWEVLTEGEGEEGVWSGLAEPQHEGLSFPSSWKASAPALEGGSR